MSEENKNKYSQIKTLDEIELIIKRYNEKKLTFKDLQDEIFFLYNIGSYYSEYYQINSPVEAIFRSKDKYYLSIYYYLKAIKIYENNKSTLDNDTQFIYEIMRRLYVNAGNEFSNQFRSIEALSYFRKALKIDNQFDMAIGNFALGIEHHSTLLGLSKDKYCLVFNLLYELYNSVNICNLDSGHKLFLSKKCQYKKVKEEYINMIIKGKDANYTPYAIFTEIDTECNNIENWCVENTLYLNYINDLGNYEEAKFDIDLTEINDELHLTETQLYTLNFLFEIYSFERKKIYHCKELDNNEKIYELMQVFQILYSYFDKIAFFIYKYFHLLGKERDVNINKIWKMKDVEGNVLLKYKNQHLYNIFWLRKEYRENSIVDMNINELLSPEAQDYADIRNTIEHKEFSFIEIDGLYYLNPDLLYKKTLKLAGVVRNMLLSLVQMIRVERKLINPKTNKRELDLVYLEYEGFI